VPGLVIVGVLEQWKEFWILGLALYFPERQLSVSLYLSIRAKPKHPILILSNLYDPVTSIENAYEILSNSFSRGDAGLGIRDGYGVRFWIKILCIVTIILTFPFVIISIARIA
jgi:hypothetical protein